MKLLRCYSAAPQNPVWILCFHISFPSLRPAYFPSGKRLPLGPGKNLYEWSYQIKPQGHACPRGLLPLPLCHPLSSLWDDVYQPSSWPPALEDKKTKMTLCYLFEDRFLSTYLIFCPSIHFFIFSLLFLTLLIANRSNIQYSLQMKKKNKEKGRK